MNKVMTVGLSYADRLTLATQSRHQALQQLFSENIASLSSLMGPMSDGPEWPSGAAWLATEHNGNSCIISDGLSDPWVERDRPETGLGLEVFIESTEIAIPEHKDFTRLADTWMFPMIAEISHTLASYPRLCEKLLNNEVLSMEFNIDHIKDGRGRVGVMLHQPRLMDHHWNNDFGDVQLIAATLLNPDELSALRGKGQVGREQLLDRLYDAGIAHHSTIQRTSLL